MAAGMKYCRKCGKPISADARFCRYCGFDLASTAPVSAAPVRPSPVSTARVSGPQVSNVPVSSLPAAAAGMAYSGEGGIKGIINLIKDPKAVIATLVMTFLWSILPSLSQRGILPAQLLSSLTFANGGIKGGAAELIGGIWGKSMIGGAVIGLSHAGFGNLAKCIQNLFVNTGEKLAVLKMIGGILLGVISYYVLCFLAAPYEGAPVAGIGGAALFLQASGSGNGKAFRKGLALGYAIGVVLFIFI